MVTQYFSFYSFGNERTCSKQRALCHEEFAFHNLLVSGLEKVGFFFFPWVPKSLIVVGTSPNAFPLGQAGVWLLVAITSEKSFVTHQKQGWESPKLRELLLESCRCFLFLWWNFRKILECAWNMHLGELDLSSAVCNLACGRGFDLQFWTALGTLCWLILTVFSLFFSFVIWINNKQKLSSVKTVKTWWPILLVSSKGKHLSCQTPGVNFLYS